MRYRATVSFAGPFGVFAEGEEYEESRPVVKDWLRAGFFVPIDDSGKDIPQKPKRVRKRRSNVRKSGSDSD